MYAVIAAYEFTEERMNDENLQVANPLSIIGTSADLVELKRLQTEISILKSANNRLRAKLETHEIVVEALVDKLRGNSNGL